jgi:hypothetical protein
MKLEQWKQAVVHLEAAADEATFEERAASPLLGGRDLRFGGTALYVRDGEKRYLVTARHVLTDPEVAARSLPDLAARGLSDEQQRTIIEGWIFGVVFRVPGLDEFKSNPTATPEFLMDLGAGDPRRAPYSFSSQYIDLAVISFNGPGSTATGRFAADLDRAGYRPVPLEHVGDEPTAEGAEILSVGFPAASVLGEQDLHPAQAYWASKFVSLPVFAFGRVAMLHSGLDSFWGDISTYPGAGGGPVVQDERLVGIVSAQASVEDVRIPYARITKARHIRALIEEQDRKDAGESGL